MDYTEVKPSRKFADLVQLIKILRKECPWDRKQTHHSIKENLVEEAYEAVESIENDDYQELSRELGDLLLHVLFHSTIAGEENRFDIEDVIFRISEKLIRRHPHIFSDTVVENEKEVAENWESIKLSEGRQSIMDGMPSTLPGLMKAQRMQEKAAGVGFDWADWTLAWEKLDEEIAEWKEAVESQSKEDQADEFGDLLFSLVNVGRLLDLNAENCMRMANEKFENRFRYIEKRLNENNKTINESGLEEMDRFWEEAKQGE
ncbi:MAG: nucleoside triphosphate pyrophosphohydrolase [Bacteroidetes bacterium]|jgi:XTP/dITP diphosphohydrolase|nr:nucleoside triphosphate pyrophosphohydrolase [Bacteroidota bacterium]